MASSSSVALSTSVQPVFAVKLREDSAQRTSELLQENHEKHHIFFNKSGFHNHIVHHLLTLFALGASPDEIRTAYDNNASYQRPPVGSPNRGPSNLDDPKTWKACLGKERHYHDFLIYFQREMERSSFQEVVNRFVFAGDERADDLLVRMHSGFLHPLIHVGFGIESQQPAIIAEALAQAAVHDNWIGKMLLPAEEAARQSGRATMDRSIASLIDECNKSDRIRTAARWEDGNKIRDGVLKRAPEELLGLLAQVVVGEDEIEERMAEMMNAALYFAACAQRPNKKAKIDFYYMHCVNCSIFFPALLGPISPLGHASKKRLLEFKIRLDIGMYASRRAPDLDLELVQNRPSRSQASWDTLFEQMCQYPDDGHASKLLRTIAAVERQCGAYESDQERFRIRGDDYLKIANMVMDSVEGLQDDSAEPRWGRSVGFDEAWADVPDYEAAALL